MNKKIIFTLSLFFLICQILSFNSFAGSYMLEPDNNETEDNPWLDPEPEVPEFNYDISNNQVTILGYCGSETEVVIPETIEGYLVTSIGDNAFNNCTSLTNISIPNSVTGIGYCAFQGCSSLTSITIPDSVISIGEDAFSGCDDVTIFCHTSSAVESYAIDNHISFVATDISMLTYTISNGEVTITGCDTSVTEVVIPDKIQGYPVTAIADSAFYGCTNLTSIELPDTLTTIGKEAFCSCIKLKSITIPRKVATIGDKALGYYNYGGTYKTVSGFTLYGYSVTENYASENNIAFVFIAQVASITITPPTKTEYYIGETLDTAGMKVIANYIDGRTEDVTEEATVDITIINTAGTVTVTVTYEEKTATFDVNVVDISMLSYKILNGEVTITDCDISATDVVIPATIEGYPVTSIGSSAFSYRDSLTSITIPDSVTSIGSSAFFGCDSLTGIWVDENNTHFSSDENGVLFNKDKTTIICCPAGIEMTSYIIPNGVTSIGDYAFFGCDSLTSITIPDSVTSIGSYAFSSCDSLTSITIPDSVTSIGSYAFYNCTSLTSVTIPDSVTSIGSSAFHSCDSLTSITLPEGVTSIGTYTFYSCTSLTSVTIPEGVTSIGTYAFYNCTSLTSVTIPDSVTSIGDRAFCDCTSLKIITIPGSVTSIGTRALGYYFDSGYKILDGFNIYGCAGSKAETYATENGIPFVAIDNAFNYKGVSLLLDGSLGVKVYFEYDRELIDASTLEYNVTFENSDNNSTTKESFPVVFEDDNKTAYTLIYIAPKDIDNITINSSVSGKLYNGGLADFANIPAITVPSYIDLLKDFAEVDEDCAKALDTVVALENYCAYANAFFNELDMDTVTLLADEETNLSKVTAPKRSGSINGLTFSQTSLILEERVAIRHYFEMADGFDVNSVTVEGATALLKLTESGKYAYVDVENIPAHELSKQYKVTLNDGTNTMTIEFSAVNYVNLNKNNADTSLSNLVKTVYRYSVEADKYYKLLNPDEEEEVIEPPFDEDELPKTEW